MGVGPPEWSPTSQLIEDSRIFINDLLIYIKKKEESILNNKENGLKNPRHYILLPNIYKKN